MPQACCRRIRWRSIGRPWPRRTMPVSPANGDVIFATASFVAENARRKALAANAAGNFDAAKAEVEGALRALHQFAKDDTRVPQLIEELQRELVEVQEAMSPMLRKSKHFASYLASSSRDAGGTARRKRP